MNLPMRPPPSKKPWNSNPTGPTWCSCTPARLLAAGDTTPAQARLDALTANTDLDTDTYKLAAGLYTEMALPARTSACLKKAVEVSNVLDTGLLADLAEAYVDEGAAGRSSASHRPGPFCG